MVVQAAGPAMPLAAASGAPRRTPRLSSANGARPERPPDPLRGQFAPQPASCAPRCGPPGPRLAPPGGCPIAISCPTNAPRTPHAQVGQRRLPLRRPLQLCTRRARAEDPPAARRRGLRPRRRAGVRPAARRVRRPWRLRRARHGHGRPRRGERREWLGERADGGRRGLWGAVHACATGWGARAGAAVQPLHAAVSGGQLQVLRAA